jgi:hypothetical protein
MAWSQSDIDALKAAMAKGVKKVRYTSGEVEYQSVADMITLLREMEREVNADGSGGRRVARVVSGF